MTVIIYNVRFHKILLICPQFENLTFKVWWVPSMIALLLSVPVKNFENRLRFDVMTETWGWHTFLTHTVALRHEMLIIFLLVFTKTKCQYTFLILPQVHCPVLLMNFRTTFHNKEKQLNTISRLSTHCITQNISVKMSQPCE